MNTLFDKIWDSHVVQIVPDGPTQLYIHRLYCPEVTRPQASEGLRTRGVKCFRADKIYCMPDHNTPTHDQDKPIEDPVSRTQVDTLEQNCKEFGLNHFGMNTDHTLEEVGQQFSVTRERIRQIEAKALRKLKHPSRSRKLRSFLDNG